MIATNQRKLDQQLAMLIESRKTIKELNTALSEYSDKNKYLLSSLNVANEKIADLETEKLDSSVDATREKVVSDNDLGLVLNKNNELKK